MIKLRITKDSNMKAQYAKLWREVGNVIKCGVTKSDSYRNTFVNFLRFESTKSNGELMTLYQYLSRMKSGQDNIFYIIVNKEQMKKSSFVQILRKKDFEVIVFIDKVDEFMIQHLGEYKGKKFQDVSENGINHILVDTPCVVVTSNYGLSSYLERLPHSRALGKRVLEINSRHPIIEKLRRNVVKDPKGENVKRIALTMYAITLRESGLELTEQRVPFSTHTTLFEAV
ncbi:endoplasmin homolog [Lycium ferocissimum]|uniref:endoplasmin homolog n=1 Tax=Lycium ferocissimum TaxID=112874 RepID=UPI002814D3C8|nr:endoplasmin homolog [Lycium ferocissimum]